MTDYLARALTELAQAQRQLDDAEEHVTAAMERERDDFSVEALARINQARLVRDLARDRFHARARAVVLSWGVTVSLEAAP